MSWIEGESRMLCWGCGRGNNKQFECLVRDPEDDSITLLDGVLNTLWESSGLMRLKVQGQSNHHEF
jgi:hypothetical protein